MTQTPSQTIGPFFAYSLTPEQYNYDHGNICGPQLADSNAEGQQITIRGTIYDGKGVSVNDAMIEIWQANHKGDFVTEKTDGFISFGRCGTGMLDDNQFEFKTIKPGSLENNAPFINVIIFMRGMLSHMYTRIYFSDEGKANYEDELLSQIPKERQHTLIAQKKDGNVYEFNIHMQGENETVFLDL